ncbi:MAG: hypothetical protein ABII81_09395 [Pseudomonadota bacterium]
MSFSEWEFLLNGDIQEFRQLASEAGSYYFNIYGGIDHWLDCPNDDFRLTSLYCEGETDAAVVWQIGYELVSLFNGASILISRDYRKAEIDRLLYQNKSIDYVPPKGFSGLLGKPPFIDERIVQEYANGKASSIKFPLLHLATEHEDVYMLLKYLDMDGSWVTYYKLMEVIEGFAKKHGIDLNADKSKRSSFTNTANNFSLSGFDSRHGFKEAVKQNKTTSMSIDEGYKFVTDMAKTYLKKMYFNKA